ncbi:hypothetical protein B0H17DRAFT_1134141 [Mycena rosella]|uniref:Helicase C-terminal domain-containing protein n=1 Tax=Mycena rosella TaxID=1033263 RepID=A0AAD7DGR5_MYCRO|nr:hypothetical protein B0H17DRAFT_1134141 [Mycena rosella]
MSREYLEDVYSSFSDPDRTALILNATAGAGEGLDVEGVNGVITHSIASDIPSKSQWDGRAGRSTNAEGFCVQMIEPWVHEIDLSQVPIDPNDSDHPLSDAALTKKNPTNKLCTAGTAQGFLARKLIGPAKEPSPAAVVHPAITL